jgi:hypothetical protein
MLLKNLSNCRPSDIVLDSTGLKVYGEGEWKVGPMVCQKYGPGAIAKRNKDFQEIGGL